MAISEALATALTNLGNRIEWGTEADQDAYNATVAAEISTTSTTAESGVEAS